MSTPRFGCASASLRATRHPGRARPARARRARARSHWRARDRPRRTSRAPRARRSARASTPARHRPRAAPRWRARRAPRVRDRRPRRQESSHRRRQLLRQDLVDHRRQRRRQLSERRRRRCRDATSCGSARRLGRCSTSGAVDAHAAASPITIARCHRVRRSIDVTHRALATNRSVGHRQKAAILPRCDQRVARGSSSHHGAPAYRGRMERSGWSKFLDRIVVTLALSTYVFVLYLDACG